jgi:hypothetical protein
MGVGGAVVLSAAATAMLLFRSAIEPWMPLVLNVILHFASRRTHGSLAYGPAAYPWIAGCVYGLGALWLVLFASAAWRKPNNDRRLDRYLMRQQEFETSRFVAPDPGTEHREPMTPPRPRPPS